MQPTHKQTCSIDGCEKPARTREWCSGHYERWRVGRPMDGPLRTMYRGSPEERFWHRVNKEAPGGCWLWTGGTTVGYGCFGVSGTTNMLAHRFAWESLVGPLASDQLLDHICRVPLCVNPGHLRVADHKRNAENHNGRPRKDGTSGYRGVARAMTGKPWRAYANHNGKYYHGGQYDDPRDAAEAARKLRSRLFTHNNADREVAQ